LAQGNASTNEYRIACLACRSEISEMNCKKAIVEVHERSESHGKAVSAKRKMRAWWRGGRGSRRGRSVRMLAAPGTMSSRSCHPPTLPALLAAAGSISSSHHRDPVDLVGSACFRHGPWISGGGADVLSHEVPEECPEEPSAGEASHHLRTSIPPS